MSGDGFTFLGYPADTYAAASHSHAGADITSGTVAYGRLPVGTASSTIAAGDHHHIRAMVSGQWRMTLGSNVGTGTHSAGVERAQPIYLPPSTALQAVAVNVTTLAASSVVRLGIRSDSNGRPGNLLADWGTVDTTGTGNKTLAITYTTPSTATRLWLTATAQGGAPVLTTRNASASEIDATVVADILAGPACVHQTGVTGALPNTFTAAGVIATATLIAVQAA